MYFGWGDFTYTTVDELKKKSTRELARLKDATPPPPSASRRAICDTWWGIAWCQNLESYADYDYRLDRGRRYYRAGCVLDLKINDNVVTAKVSGSENTPYNIKVVFKKPSKKDMAEITKIAARRIDNIESLLKGDFPKDLQELFRQTKPGLFPTPKEITFECNCLDWASMCKHVAAVMYGIGRRIDTDPTEIFKLRGIDIENFLSGVIDDKVSDMLAHVNVKSKRIIKDADIEKIFGI